MTPLLEDATGNDLTYRVIGAAMAVHNGLGAGYKEEVYERALEVDLKATSGPVGLLFNFGRRKLEYHRIFPPKTLDRPEQRLGRDDVRKSQRSEK
jgi:hypothetical protein